MKYTFLLLIILAIFTFTSLSSKTSSKIPNQKINIQIVDEATNETLVGVKNGNQYSNLDGLLLVNTNEPISLELISYEKCTIIAKNDTIIKMKSLR